MQGRQLSPDTLQMIQECFIVAEKQLNPVIKSPWLPKSSHQSFPLHYHCYSTLCTIDLHNIYAVSHNLFAWHLGPFRRRGSDTDVAMLQYIVPVGCQDPNIYLLPEYYCWKDLISLDSIVFSKQICMQSNFPNQLMHSQPGASGPSGATNNPVSAHKCASNVIQVHVLWANQVLCWISLPFIYHFPLSTNKSQYTCTSTVCFHMDISTWYKM